MLSAPNTARVSQSFSLCLIGLCCLTGCRGTGRSAKNEPGRGEPVQQIARDEGDHRVDSAQPGDTRQVVFRLDEPESKDEPKAKPKNDDPLEPLPVPDAAKGLTLAKLLVVAVENNPSLAAARSKAAARGWKVPQVKSLDDPMVSTTLFLDSIETAAGSQDVIVSVSQKLPWFGKLKLRGQVASADAEALWWEAEAIRIQIMEQVQLAYFDYAYLASAHKVLTALEPKISSLIKITRAKFRAEVDPKKRIGFETVLQAEVELHKLQTRLAEIEEAQKRVVARLKELLNRKQDVPLAISTTNEVRKVPAELKPLLTLVDECQPKLLARMWESRRDAAGIALAKKNYYPDLTLGLNWYGISNSGISPVTNGDDAAAMMLGINVPIYRKKLQAADNEAQWRYTTSRHQAQSTANRFRSEVAALHADAKSHDRVLTILDEKIIRRSRRALDLSLQSWRQDRIEFQRVIENYQAVVRFELSILQHRRQINRTLASLERAIGCAAASWDSHE